MIRVPGPDAPWWPDICDFALSFDAYSRVGDFEKVAAKAERVARRFAEAKPLPDDLGRLRTALFFEQRRWRHLEGNPLEDPAVEPYLRALVAKIAELSGGAIDEEPDPPL